MKSILAVGQSNMAGRGHLGEVPPVDNRDLYMLRMGRWCPMSEPVNADRHITGRYASGVSMLPSFAAAYRDAYGEPTGIIPCADGGTKIAEWMPGEILYDHAVMMTGLAKRTSELAGIIWHQGESDCRETPPEVYEEKLCTMLASLRRDIGAEGLPLVLGEIYPRFSSEHLVTPEQAAGINAAIHRAADRLPKCGCAETSDLALQDDGIHFDAASQRILGVRYFNIFRTLA